VGKRDAEDREGHGSISLDGVVFSAPFKLSSYRLIPLEGEDGGGGGGGGFFFRRKIGVGGSGAIEDKAFARDTWFTGSCFLDMIDLDSAAVFMK